jgi:hypothetical protein
MILIGPHCRFASVSGEKEKAPRDIRLKTTFSPVGRDARAARSEGKPTINQRYCYHV